MGRDESDNELTAGRIVGFLLIVAAIWFAWGNWSVVNHWDRPGFYDRMLREYPDAGVLAKAMWFQLTHSRLLFLGACLATVVGFYGHLRPAGDYTAVLAMFLVLGIIGFFAGRAYDDFAACAQVRNHWTCDDWLQVYALLVAVASSLLLVVFALKIF